MPDAVAEMIWNRQPTAERPLLGQTALVVEDSRFACEAIRLLCLRSGARIRRADSLRAAARHLAVYRPSIVMVDLGLPDGSGLQLLRDLSRAQPRVAVLLAMSGDDGARTAALGAGADDFLPKPLTSVAAFQSAILAHLPPDRRPAGPRILPEGSVVPDAIALRDDLAHVSELLRGAPDESSMSYAAQFVRGLAVTSGDAALKDAAAGLSRSGPDRAGAAAALARLIEERLSLAAVV